MERAHELREKATRCLRLSGSINCPADVTWLETLAAEATQAAERLEAEHAARVAGRHPSNQFVEESRGEPRGGPATFEGPDAFTYRDAELASDTFPDRRRAGRRDDVSSVLIPLLREDSITALPGEAADQLRAPRGVIIWTLISAAAWAPLLWWVL
jgi:hypothetical protein